MTGVWLHSLFIGFSRREGSFDDTAAPMSLLSPGRLRYSMDTVLLDETANHIKFSDASEGYTLGYTCAALRFMTELTRTEIHPLPVRCLVR